MKYDTDDSTSANSNVRKKNMNWHKENDRNDDELFWSVKVYTSQGSLTRKKVVFEVDEYLRDPRVTNCEHALTHAGAHGYTYRCIRIQVHMDTHP